MNYETAMHGNEPGGQRIDLPSSTSGMSASMSAEMRDEAQAQPSRRWMIYALGAALLMAAILTFFMMRGGVAPVDDSDSQLQLVTITSPGTGTIAGQIEVTGTLAARRPVPVGSVGEGGRVVSVPVDAGDWVKQGQVLVVIDRSVQIQQARSAAAQVEVARADANLAQANLDRALKLVDRGFISKADVDRLTATRDAARARVDVARAQLSELQARTARLNIYAPASGLVLERNVEPGQTVGGGSTPLFTIARGGEMEMLAQVGENELAQLSTGVSAEVTPVGIDKSFTGQVWQLSPIIDANNRQGTARIALPYAAGLRPGGFATARINSGTIVAPMLPESAIQSDDQGAYVFIIDKDNKVERRAIVTGMVTADGIAIASGLDGSEQIVMRAGGFLNPGETVRVRRPQTAEQPQNTQG